MLKVQTASTWPACRQVTWAAPLSKVPATFTTEVVPADSFADTAPTGVSRIVRPVSSRDESSVAATVPEPLTIVTLRVMTALVEWAGFATDPLPPAPVVSCCGPRAVTRACAPPGNVIRTGPPIASSAGCPGEAVGVGSAGPAVGIGTAPSAETTADACASGSVGALELDAVVGGDVDEFAEQPASSSAAAAAPAATGCLATLT